MEGPVASAYFAEQIHLVNHVTWHADGALPRMRMCRAPLLSHTHTLPHTTQVVISVQQLRNFSAGKPLNSSSQQVRVVRVGLVGF